MAEDTYLFRWGMRATARGVHFPPLPHIPASLALSPVGTYWCPPPPSKTDRMLCHTALVVSSHRDLPQENQRTAKVIQAPKQHSVFFRFYFLRGQKSEKS